MFEGLIERLILSYFGDYIENLDRNKLTIGLWSGSLELEDIMIRSKAINELKLPFKFHFGKIGKLQLIIPWKQNFSVPTIINIDSIQIVLSVISESSQWEFIDYNSFENKMYYLMKFSNERIYQLGQAFISQSAAASSGYIERVIVKVLDNLHVNFKNINIRIEDVKNNVSLGFTLQEMFVVNTNEKYEQEFIDRNVNKNANIYKLLQISNFGVYLNPKETFFISNLSNNEIEEKISNLFPKNSEKAIDIEYLLQPMTLTAKMKQRNNNENLSDEELQTTSRMNLLISLDKFDFVIQKEQYDCIIKMMNTISNYQKVLYDYNNTVRYKYFRPKLKLSDIQDDDLNNNNDLEEKLISDEIKNIKKNTIIKWWKFAIRMVIRQIKFSKGNENIFKIPDIIRENYKEKFNNYFKIYFKENDNNNNNEINESQMTEEEKNEFKKIIELTELKDLYIWSKPVLQEIYTEKKKEEKKNAQKGYFSSWLGSSINEKDLISPEEEEKIEEILSNAVKEATTLIINNEIETKLQLNFELKKGSFKFIKIYRNNDNNGNNVSEGFNFIYENLIFMMKKGEYFNEIESSLKTFHVDMYTSSNNNITLTPITFFNLEDIVNVNNEKYNKNNKDIIIEKDIKNDDLNIKKEIENENENEINIDKKEENKDEEKKEENKEEEKNEENKEENKEEDKKEEEKNEENKEEKKEEDKKEEEKKEEYKEINFKEEIENQNNFLRIFFRKNNPNDLINTKFKLVINILHFTYHQVFLERVISFFKVQLDEDLADKAWEQYNTMKKNTTNALIDNIYKKNIINIEIEPRKIIIPINKYDLKNTKILLVDLGKVDNNINEDNNNINENDKYKERYSLSIHSFSISYFPSFKEMLDDDNKIQIVSNFSGNFSIGFLSQDFNPEENASLKLFMSVDSITFDLNSYIYTLMIYVMDIFKPTKERDIYSQINSSKEEIKKNSKISSKILKKNPIYFNYEEYYATLSSGYIYFYKNMDDENYIGYYYLKDSKINKNEDSLWIKLTSIYGSIELKFENLEEFNNWNKCINTRLIEMKISSINKIKEIESEKSEGSPKVIYFGSEITFNKVYINLYEQNSKVPFSNGEITNFSTNLNLRTHDTEIILNIQGLKLYDTSCENEDMKTILKSENKNSNDLFKLSVLVCDEESDKYNNIQIDVNVLIGYCYIIWNPIIIKKILGFTIHNDIMKYKVRREISNQTEKLVEDKFLERGFEEKVQKLKCNKEKYTYLKLHSSFKEVSIILIQPILNIMFYEMKFGESYLDSISKVDHLLVTGELGNSEIFDLCQYPFVIENQSQFDKNKIKKVFGVKSSDNHSLISFSYKSMYNWCPECKNNYLSEADITINSAFLILIYENFIRFFNYFISQFLGSLGSNEETKAFKNKFYKIKQKEKDIDFMRINMIINNPQVILKPRYDMKEYFLFDLGDILMKCNYQKVFGKLRSNPEEYRWLVTYQFEMKNIAIKAEDNFNIISPTNSIVNMHFVYYTEKDKLLNELEFDFSYHFDLYFNDINMKMRQRDFTNLMRCSDLNILYTDEKYEYYNYEKFYNNLKKNKSSLDSLNLEEEKKEEKFINNNENLKKEYMSLITYIMFKKLSLTLYLDDIGKETFSPFVEFILKEMQLDFNKKLNNTKETHIIIANMEMYDISCQNKFKLLSDFTQKIIDYSDVNSDRNSDKNSKNNKSSGPIKHKKSFSIFKVSNSYLNIDESNLFNETISSDSFIKKIKNDILNCVIINPQFILTKGSKIQTEIQIIIDNEREKNYSVIMNGFKLLIKLDTFQLCRYFFLQGFPYYAKNLKDLPNLYDPNDENNPGFNFHVQLKHPMICFFTDSISNIDQELICITSEVSVGIKNEKISKIKKELIEKYTDNINLLKILSDKSQKKSLQDYINNDCSYNYIMTCSLDDISPFFCEYKDITHGEKELIISKRKIMDNFDFKYEYKIKMVYKPDNQFLSTNLENIDLSKMAVKASYRDLVLYIKLGDFYYNLLNENYTKTIDYLHKYDKEKKKFEKYEEKNKRKIENEILKKNKEVKDLLKEEKEQLIFKREFRNNGIQLILIDDHSNTFYPFLSFSIVEFNIKTENQIEIKNMQISLIFKVLSYNYLAGVWEPVIEKTKLTIDSVTDQLNNRIYTLKTYNTKKVGPDININISDLMIIFLSRTLNKWFDKYYKLKNNYKNEFKNIQNEKNMTISNHTLFNYTGRTLSLYRRYGLNNIKKLKLSEISPNDSYEIEYFETNSSDKKIQTSLIKDNFISFRLDNACVSNHIIKIDNIQSKIHIVDYSKIFDLNSNSVLKELNTKFNYVISKIEFHSLKKFIYFYSPLSFKNKTKFNFHIDLRNNITNNLSFDLEPKQIIGIPFEFLNGDIEIKLGNSKIFKRFGIYHFLESNKEIIDEVEYKDENHISTYIHFCNSISSISNNNYKNRIIKLRTSFTIRNCLPFDIQTIVNDSHNFFNIKKNEIVPLNNISIKAKLFIQLFFYEFKTLESVQIQKYENNTNIPITVYDKHNNSITVYVSLFDREIIIHANTIIINHTNLNLCFYYGEDENEIENKVANQKGTNNFFILDNHKFIKILYNNYISKPIAINTIGASSVIKLINYKLKSKIEIVIEIVLSLVALDLDIYTNIITLSPRYIIYNLLNDYSVEIIHDNINNKVIDIKNKQIQKVNKLCILNPGEKHPLYYSEYNNENEGNGKNYKGTKLYKKKFIENMLRFVLLNKENNINKFLASSPYSTECGTLTTIINSTSKDKNEQSNNTKYFFNIEKKVDNLTTYLILSETNFSNSQIQITNNSNLISFEIWQNDFIDNIMFFNPKTKGLFAWSDITKRPILNFNFYLGDGKYNPSKLRNHFHQYEILEDKIVILQNKKNFESIEKYPFNENITLMKNKFQGISFNISFIFNGNRVIIKIENVSSDKIKEIKNREILITKNRIELNVHINRLGISVIGDNKYLNKKDKKKEYKRQEILYLTLDNIIFYTKIEERENNEKLIDSQLIIKNIESDNEITYLTNFPIILLPQNSWRRNIVKDKNPNKLTKNSPQIPFVNFALFMSRKKNDNITLIKLLNFLIQSFELNIESNILLCLFNFFSNLSIGLSTSLTQINPLFQNDEILQLKKISIQDFNYKPEWLTEDKIKEKLDINSPNQNTLFINHLDASSLEFSLTFYSQSKDKVFQKLLQGNKLLNDLLNAVSSIDRVPLLLNGFQIFNFQGNLSSLLSYIYEIYKQRALVQIMRIFGGIEILGSPLNLINSLSQGFKDLFNKPVEGIVNGPLGGAMGLVNGGISLAKHTVDGTFNTTSKITSGLSKGMLLLTQDDEYIDEREKKKVTEKPKNVIEGIGYGLSSMANGFFKGITDVVVKPIEGAQKDSVKGFGKGLLQGLGGAIIKPISGVFDLVSKTTEGIKNGVNDDISIERIRRPRAFYGKVKFIKSFNEKDANVIELLTNKIEQLKEEKIDYLDSEVYVNHKEESILLVFLTIGIYIIDVVRRELKTHLDYSIIQDVKIENNTKIRLFFTKEVNRKKYTSISLSKKSENIRKIFNKIKDAIDSFSEERNMK